MRRLLPNSAALAFALALAMPAIAQDHSQHQPPADAREPEASSPHAGHGEPPESEPAQDHAAMGHAMPATPPVDHAAVGHGAAAATTQPIEPIPAVTDADRAAAFPELTHAMQHAPEFNYYLLFDRLEAVDVDDGTGQAWEIQGWLGSDLNRLWLRSEGERDSRHTEAADLELLYGRSVSPWWDVVAGVKHDFKPGESQSWAALGVQGMSPYKFEVEATAYVGESGRTAASIEIEYDVLLTNRLILQPLVEVELYGKDDAARGIGSGLSSVEAGLRLRYEFTRQFAPYIGVTHERAFGNTADFRRDEGEGIEDTRLVAGLRMWF